MEFLDNEDDIKEDIGFWYSKADCDIARKAFIDRVKDVAKQALSADISAIRGLATTDVVSLQEALIPLTEHFPNIESFVEQVSNYIKRLSKLPEGLSEEDFGVLLVCTWPWEDLPGGKTLYHVINSKLRLPDRQQLQPFLLLLKLFLTVLYKLPAYQGSVWSGTRQDVTTLYKEGQRLTWWGFGSFTERLPVLNHHKCLGKVGTMTLFTVNTTRGFKVNLVPNVAEIIIPPGSKMKVLNVYNAGQGVKIVELQESIPEIGLIDFPRAVYELGSEEFFLSRLEDASTTGQWDKFVSTLKALPWNREAYLYTNGFQTLCQCLTNGDHEVQTEDVPGLTELVLNVMKFHHNKSDLQAQGCSTLQILGVNGWRDVGLGQKLLQAIVTAMADHINDKAMLLAGSSLLPPLLHNDWQRRSAAKYGLIQASLLGLKTHRDDPEVFENFCRVLAILSLNVDNRASLCKADWLLELLEGLRIHVDNASVTNQGLLLMSRIFLTKGQVNTNVYKDSADLIIEAMKKHPAQPGVQQNGCLAVARLSISAPARQKVGAVGGVTVVLSCMATNPDHRTIQRNGCLALAQLAECRENLLEILKENGVQIIMALVAEHEEAEGVQEAACAVITALSRSSHCLSTIDKKQLLETVTSGMIRHFHHRGVQANGCQTLGVIWADDEELTTDKLSTPEYQNAIEAVLRSVTCHPDHVATQEFGYLALATISERFPHQAIIKDGDVVVAITALSAQADRASVQHNVLRLLAWLSRNPHYQQIIVHNGGIPEIAKALITRPYHSKTQAYGCHILSRLAVKSENHKWLSDSLVIEATTSAKENCLHDGEVQKYVTSFFKQIRMKKTV